MGEGGCGADSSSPPGWESSKKPNLDRVKAQTVLNEFVFHLEGK